MMVKMRLAWCLETDRTCFKQQNWEPNLPCSSAYRPHSFEYDHNYVSSLLLLFSNLDDYVV